MEHTGGTTKLRNDEIAERFGSKDLAGWIHGAFDGWLGEKK